MPTLYLLRHAKSGWDDPGVADIDRVLSNRGVRAAGAMAEHIRAAAIAPELVLCSPAVRTRQTVDLIGLGPVAPRQVSFEDDLYGATAETLLARLRDIPVQTTSVLVVGHNPGIEDLAAALASGGRVLDRLRVKFPTCALATLSFSEWSTLAPGGAELVAFITPADLG